MNITEKQYSGLNMDSLFWDKLIYSFTFATNKNPTIQDLMGMKEKVLERVRSGEKEIIHRYSKMLTFKVVDIGDEELLKDTLHKPYDNIHIMTNTAMTLIDKIKVKGDNGINELSKLDKPYGKIILDKNRYFCYNLPSKSLNQLDVLFVDSKQIDGRSKQVDYSVFGYDLNKMQIRLGNLKDDSVEKLFRKVMLYIFFTDKETQYIESGKNNGKTKKNGKITNSTEYNITIVDSKWNVDVIRTKGFNVSGHFRLQPYGNEKTRTYKVIYIEPFRKKGYKRLATKSTME